MHCNIGWLYLLVPGSIGFLMYFSLPFDGFGFDCGHNILLCPLRIGGLVGFSSSDSLFLVTKKMFP
jgi:hypothetical protein